MSGPPDERQHTNRLVHETSPYLLQHAHNPVDWYPWGDEALRRAKEEDRLILLSIGYSACHWCHVMERESFEDEETAAFMNEHFINIKLDREERPDLDEIYMAATLALRGQGGWPMTVFLTSDLEPVYAGTYFPPEDRGGLPAFRRVLETMARAWREKPDEVRGRAADLVEHLRGQAETGRALTVGEDELRAALDDFGDAFDGRHGGFGSAPKFPPAVGIRLLLRLHRRFGEARALEMADATLEGMARGGIYDQVGGGFCRYSTDTRWLVPHFEKMLYDNALLVPAYLEAYQVTGRDDHRRVAVETLDYVLREMTGPEGGFHSSTDAESEGVEGKFFVWTPAEIHQAVGDDELARRFCAYYDIRPGGNREGASIPNTPRPVDAVAEELDVAPDQLRRSLATARERVFEAREKRVRPGLDDKVITAWNGLMIGALADGYRVLGRLRYLAAARRGADFLLEALRADDGRLLRTYRAGRAHLPAVLEDYAYLACGLIDLAEAGGGPRYLRTALDLVERAQAEFGDHETGAFFSTARGQPHLLFRHRDGADGATPAPNAMAAWALARLSYHLDREDLRAAAARAIRAYGQGIRRYPRGFAASLCVVDFLLARPLELALIGGIGDDDLEALRTAVARRFLPDRIQMTCDPEAAGTPEEAELPLLAGKARVDGRAALYVCRDFACGAPVTSASEVGAALDGAARWQRGAAGLAVALEGRATPDGTARYAARFR